MFSGFPYRPKTCMLGQLKAKLALSEQWVCVPSDLSRMHSLYDRHQQNPATLWRHRTGKIRMDVCSIGVLALITPPSGDDVNILDNKLTPGCCHYPLLRHLQSETSGSVINCPDTLLICQIIMNRQKLLGNNTGGTCVKHQSHLLQQ